MPVGPLAATGLTSVSSTTMVNSIKLIFFMFASVKSLPPLIC